MELGLKGRKAFITGASRGIGAAIARALAAEGVDLALFGREAARCEALAGDIRRDHGVAVAVGEFDFERPDEIPGAVRAAADALGAVDILVNNAGGAARGHLADLTDEAWDNCFAVKPIGLMRMSRETLSYLEASDQPRIVNIAGTRGREPSAITVMAGPNNFGT